MSLNQFSDSPRTGCWGDRPYAIIEFAGPSSYTQLSRAAANTAGVPTGGQAIGPSNFGLSAGLEGIFPLGCSSTGNYSVEAVQLTSYNQGSNNTTWALIWTVTSTGAEVAASTALNNEIVRLLAFGPY